MRTYTIKEKKFNKTLFQHKGNSLKEIVEIAIKKNINLAGARLDGVNLDRVNLTGARLDGVNFDRASFVRANFAGACLNEVSLDGVNFDGANLDGASFVKTNINKASFVEASLNRASLVGINFDGVCLDEANLDGADFGRADINEASFVRASLVGTNFIGARFKDVKIEDNIIINSRPIQILGLRWAVIVFEKHMRIGCEFHSLKDWENFSDEEINQMDTSALSFWKEHKKQLLSYFSSGVSKQGITELENKVEVYTKREAEAIEKNNY